MQECHYKMFVLSTSTIPFQACPKLYGLKLCPRCSILLESTQNLGMLPFSRTKLISSKLISQIEHFDWLIVCSLRNQFWEISFDEVNLEMILPLDTIIVA